jgi:hypothetical protein
MTLAEAVCAEGFDAVTHPGSGRLLKCVKPGLKCAAISNAVVDIAGTGCACADGFKPQLGTTNTAELICVPKVPEAAKAINDNATAVSSTWVVIPVLANDLGTARSISVVSQPSRMGGAAGGRVVIVRNSTGMDSVKYLSRDSFTGMDSFSYTTTDGTATVTVSVTPGDCLNN